MNLPLLRGVIALLLLLSCAGRAAETKTTKAAGLPGFTRSPYFGEQTLTTSNATLGVRTSINAPAPEAFAPGKPVTLVYFGLPNGNTIEQTAGRKMQPGDDWHFDIQHIAAQTRFLRQRLTNETIVVAYLENSLKAWPSWRKKNGDAAIPGIFAEVRNHFTNYPVSVVLSGHSGGGSLLFGYLNTLEKIPDDIARITFLDSNYGYETALHKAKFVDWLKASDHHHLVILAYHDSIALLNGKTFVSAAGGTWGKSHLMKDDLGADFKLTPDISKEFENYSGLDGRLRFFMRENPEKKIYHTVQVERNGFIHVLLTGTPLEGKGYVYFGDRAYPEWVQAGE